MSYLFTSDKAGKYYFYYGLKAPQIPPQQTIEVMSIIIKYSKIGSQARQQMNVFQCECQMMQQLLEH
jgi:hypothetical protein